MIKKTVVKRKWMTVTVRTLLILVPLTLMAIGHWIERKFGAPSLDQILYHLQYGSEGLAGSDDAFVSSFIRNCLLVPLGATVAILFIQARQPLAWRWYALLFAVGVGFFSQKVSLAGHVRMFFGEDYFSSHYVDPRKVKITPPAHKKNLVMIYVESLEATYSNKKLFGKDLLADLGPQSIAGTRFTAFNQAPGATWTIAGLTATQCGVPLKSVTGYSNNTQGEKVLGFLPGAVCLGDILDSYGYRNVFLGGAALHFSGKGLLLQNHHFHKTMGRIQWEALGTPRSAMNGWGLYDDDLFAKARKEVDELAAADQPFNLTLLTVDTHHPSGFISPFCAKRGVKDFTGIVECTAFQVREFIRYLDSRGYLKNTNVIVMGDHQAMENPVSEKLRSVPRTIFNLFVADKVPEKNRDTILHFDMMPTILEFLGFDVEGDRLGLGYSAWKPTNVLPPETRLAEMWEKLLNYSVGYLSLWNPASN